MQTRVEYERVREETKCSTHRRSGRRRYAHLSCARVAEFDDKLAAGTDSQNTQKVERLIQSADGTASKQAGMAYHDNLLPTFNRHGGFRMV